MGEIKPLTDEEFEELKGKRTRCLYRREWTIEEIDRLIATVESLKNRLHTYQIESDYQGDYETWVKELKEENAKLKFIAEFMEEERDKPTNKLTANTGQEKENEDAGD